MSKSSSFVLLTVIAFVLFSLPRISPVKADKTIYIRSDGSVDPSSAPIQRNGDIYVLTGDVSNDSYGIRIERNNMTLDGAGYTIQGTEAQNSVGIYLSSKNNVTIKNVKVRAYSYGVRLEFSTNNTIIGSSFTANGWDGVSISGSSMQDPSVGKYNSIIGNNITANYETGIGFYSSSNNTVSGNNITDNSQDGLHLFWSSYNVIYDNRFVNNSHQVYLEASYGHVWDNGYPSGGNYWSDYTGSDTKKGIGQNVTGSDGIGDTPYDIDADNRDHYPKIPEFPAFWIIPLLTIAALAARTHRKRLSI